MVTVLIPILCLLAAYSLTVRNKIYNIYSGYCTPTPDGVTGIFH